MSRPRLALLVCDTPHPSVAAAHGDYHQIFSTLLRASLPKPAKSDEETFVLIPYDVVDKMEYPSEDEEDRLDAVILTGSAASAYEDKEWINKLVTYVRRLAEAKPYVKIIGICFGHQIVARALGGECVPNNGRWELAITSVQLTELGRSIFNADSINIQQMHRDHVPSVPPSFSLLGATSITPNQGMVRFYSPSTVSSQSHNPEDIHILTLQGHPEFTSDIVRLLIDSRSASGILSPEVAREATSRVADRNDGVYVVGKAVWRVLGVEA